MADEQADRLGGDIMVPTVFQRRREKSLISARSFSKLNQP